jgi:hypothetical protein
MIHATAPKKDVTMELDDLILMKGNKNSRAKNPFFWMK